MPIVQESAAGTAPINVRDGVPKNKAITSIQQYSIFRPIIIYKIGERITKGRPLVNQCEKHFVITTNSKDIPDISIQLKYSI